jgi:hypothetical protein
LPHLISLPHLLIDGLKAPLNQLRLGLAQLLMLLQRLLVQRAKLPQFNRQLLQLAPLPRFALLITQQVQLLQFIQPHFHQAYLLPLCQLLVQQTKHLRFPMLQVLMRFLKQLPRFA